MKTLKESILDQIENMSESELVELNNAYCQSANYPDDEIYNNDEEFFEVFFSDRVVEAVRAATYGDYSFGHSYVKFNGYGNLESMNYVGTDDLIESPETIAEYAIENESDFDMLDFDFEEEETES